MELADGLRLICCALAGIYVALSLRCAYWYVVSFRRYRETDEGGRALLALCHLGLVGGLLWNIGSDWGTQLRGWSLLAVVALGLGSLGRLSLVRVDRERAELDWQPERSSQVPL